MSPEKGISRRDFIKLLTVTTAGVILVIKGKEVIDSFTISATTEPAPLSSPLPTGTPFQPIETIENTSTPTPELTPTVDPYDFGEINFKEGSIVWIELNTDLIKINTDKKKEPKTFKLKYYPDVLPTPTSDGNPITRTVKSPYQDFYNQEFPPGKGISLVEIENYGNIILYLHSGYHNFKKLEAEDLRKFFEGGNYHSELTPLQIVPQIKYLEGKELTINVNGESKIFEILAVARIPNSEMPRYNYNSKEALDIISPIDPKFEYFKAFPGGVLISFCGWGPEEYEQNDRYSYTRYVIGLKPVNQSPH